MSRDPIGEKGGKHLYIFARNAAMAYRDALGLSVDDSGFVELGELSHDEYRIRTRRWGLDPALQPGYTSGYWDFVAECLPCEEGGASHRMQCARLTVVVDTFLLGIAVWVSGAFERGRTYGEHELLHVAALKTGANKFDGILHALAGSGCGSRTCCAARKQYLASADEYYRVWFKLEAALLDVEDYPPATIELAIEDLRRAMEEAGMADIRLLLDEHSMQAACR